MSGPPTGLLVSFEGLDGSGKTTQARRLTAYLARLGVPVVHTRQPGGTPVGRGIRRLLLRPPGTAVEPLAELLLMMADRAQHVAEVVRPALAAGRVVVCERFSDASVAYQAFGLGLDRAVVERLNRLATGGLSPDLTILLDLSPHQRLGSRRRPADAIEGRDAAFFERVRQGYLALAGEEPGRFAVIPVAGATRQQVHRAVVSAVHRRLGQRLLQLSRREAGIGQGAGGG